MSSARPFTDPASVGLVGAALLGLAAASFTSNMMRQLRVPGPDNSATVVVLPPTDAPPPLSAELLAAAAQAAKPAAPAPPTAPPRPRRPPVIEAPPATVEPPALAAADAATEAVATAPNLVDLVPPPRPSLEPLP